MRRELPYIYISIFTLLLSNTLGFDGYWHAIAVSSVVSHAPSDYFWVIEGFAFPRYLIFHYLFYTITLFGVLPFYPFLILFYSVALWELYKSLPRSRIVTYVTILAFLYFALFSSALGLSFNLLIVGIFTTGLKKSFFLILGGLMHPLGFIITVFYLIWARLWVQCLSIFLVLGCLVTASTVMLDALNPSSREIFLSHYILNFSELLDSYLINIIYGKFLSEGFYLLFLLVLLKFSRALFLFEKFLPKFHPTYLLAFSLSILLYSIPAQFRTGGPLSLPVMLLDSLYATDVNAGKVNLLLGAWVSPLLFTFSEPTQTFYYRESMY